MLKMIRIAAQGVGRRLPLWAFLCSCPLAAAMPFQVMSTANALGTRNTALGQAPVFASGTSNLQSPGLNAVASGSAQTDPLWREVHASMSLTVNNYDCATAGNSACGVQVGSVGGTIQDVVHAISNTAGFHAINIYFRPIEYDGQLSFSGIYGFPTGAVFVSDTVTATIPSTVPGGFDTVFSDIAPKTFNTYTDYNVPVFVSGKSNGMMVTVDNLGTFNLSVSWGFQMSLYQGGIATGVTHNANGSMLADFSHTMNWGGVAFAIDAVTGHQITDLQLVSDSGNDWTKPGTTPPVPEPGTALMWLVGLGGIAANAARRARRR